MQSIREIVFQKKKKKNWKSTYKKLTLFFIKILR